MHTNLSEIRLQLMARLVKVDEQVREERAERILWMGEFAKSYAVMAHADTLSVFSEARECFINGHYIATQILALAFVEHVLAERLIDCGLTKSSGKFADSIKLAQQHEVLPSPLLVEADRLRELRNPFVHRQYREKGQKLGLGARVMSTQQHPDKILEVDAKAAIVLLWDIYDVWVNSD